MTTGKKIDTIYLIQAYPIIVVTAKVVRWTVMKNLIAYSQGTGLIGAIRDGPWGFSLFGWEEIANTGSDISTNIVFLMKIVNLLFFNYCETFADFEMVITIVWNVLTLLMLTKLKKGITLLQMCFSILSIMLLNMCTFCLSKEVMQSIYFMLMFVFLTNKNYSPKVKTIGVYGCFLLSVFTFRVYYSLMIVFAAMIHLLLSISIGGVSRKKGNRNTKKMRFVEILFGYVVIVLLYVVIMLITKAALPQIYDSLRGLMCYSSMEGVANTYFVKVFVTRETSNITLLVAEYALKLLRMLFPVELLSLGWKYWFYAAYQIMIAFYIIKGLRNYRTIETSVKLAVVAYIGYLCGSVAFETDHGTWVRHETAVVPLILVLSGSVVTESKQSNTPATEGYL